MTLNVLQIRGDQEAKSIYLRRKNRILTFSTNGSFIVVWQRK